MADIALIAVDWGTSRFRAFALDPAGAVVGHVAADDGMATIAPGGFPAVLERHVGAWMAAGPAPVLMAGMVGSRNGWVEAPYVPCPAAPGTIAGAIVPVAGRVSVIPGVIARAPSGADVMRGEETLIIGSGRRDGLVCLPGTHSKWARIEGGRILDFATFMTGESYDLYRHHSLLARLAAEPADEAGFALGLEAARDPAGLLNRLFQARARVLDGAMSGATVGPYLSGLLIGSEIAGALARYGEVHGVTLVADGILAHNYHQALSARGIAADLITPEAAFLAGIGVLARARA